MTSKAKTSYNYSTLEYINSSALQFINPEQGGNPVKYRSFILNQHEPISKSFFALGTNLHFVFLEQKVPIIIKSLPSDSIKAILDEVLAERKILNDKAIVGISKEIEDWTDSLLKIARKLKYQAKWKDETMVTNLVKSGKEYWQVMVELADVPIVSEKQQALIANIRANLELRPAVKELLSTQEEKDIEYFTELEVIWEEPWTGFKMKCKSKLDRVKLNHITKTFSVRDFKTTGKPLESFQDSFEVYRYYRQIKFYIEAFQQYLEQKGLKGYKPDTTYIIVAETAPEGRVRSFEVSQPYLFKGDMEIRELMTRIKTHTEESNWIFSLEEQKGEHFQLIPTNF